MAGYATNPQSVTKFLWFLLSKVVMTMSSSVSRSEYDPRYHSPFKGGTTRFVFI